MKEERASCHPIMGIKYFYILYFRIYGRRKGFMPEY